MRKYFCDKCGKELKEKDIKFFHGFDPILYTDEEVCEDCFKKLEAKTDEIIKMRKRIAEEYRKKINEAEDKILNSLKIKKEVLNNDS